MGHSGIAVFQHLSVIDSTNTFTNPPKAYCDCFREHKVTEVNAYIYVEGHFDIPIIFKVFVMEWWDKFEQKHKQSSGRLLCCVM